MASVQQHKSKWRTKWRDDTGRAIYQSFSTKKEADAFARKVEAKTVLDGAPPIAVDTDALTLSRWWSRWEPGRPWRDSTRAAHTGHWRRYISPVFGKVPIEQITTADVSRFHRRLEARGLAPGTVGSIHATLSMCLQAALEDGLVDRNAARYARLRRQPKTPPVALDASTTAALLDAIEATAPPGLGVYARLIAATGLRRSEAAGLSWDRCDLDAGVIVVDRQLDYSAKTQPAWAPTKNNGRRRVLLTDAVVADLRAHRAAQATVIGGTGLVFAKPDGQPWPPATLHDAWTRAAKLMAANGNPLPSGARGWHTLRHGVASRLLEQGVPPVEAAEMLGHSAEMLLSVYAHVTDRSAADARLRAALDG